MERFERAAFGFDGKQKNNNYSLLLTPYYYLFPTPYLSLSDSYSPQSNLIPPSSIPYTLYAYINNRPYT